MINILHTHWLWFFGALDLGLPVGWLTYLRPVTRGTVRPVHIVAFEVVTIGAILAIATAIPLRFGDMLNLGVILTVLYTAGCFIGWALRDLAEFMPVTQKSMTPTAAMTGSYLFRDAFAGMGASTAYLRTPTLSGGVARERLELGTGAVTRAPARGGYTFPKALPFADATASRRAAPRTGLRPHWSWPREAEPSMPPSP